jgi:hypothetical protein
MSTIESNCQLLVGENRGIVNNSYSCGNVSNHSRVGGLVGWNKHGTVSSSFCDVEGSGIGESDGGTGKTIVEISDVATFSGGSWNIVAVADTCTRNSSYIWNIVDGETYPFLSWQFIS